MRTTMEKRQGSVFCPKFSEEFDSVLLSSGNPLEGLYNIKRLNHEFLPPIMISLSEPQVKDYGRLIAMKTLNQESGFYDCILWNCLEEH